MQCLQLLRQSIGGQGLAALALALMLTPAAVSAPLPATPKQTGTGGIAVQVAGAQWPGTNASMPKIFASDTGFRIITAQGREISVPSGSPWQDKFLTLWWKLHDPRLGYFSCGPVIRKIRILRWWKNSEPADRLLCSTTTASGLRWKQPWPMPSMIVYSATIKRLIVNVASLIDRLRCSLAPMPTPLLAGLAPSNIGNETLNKLNPSSTG